MSILIRVGSTSDLLMSKSKYVTGLRAVEQLLATPDTEVRRIYAEYQTANPRVTTLIAEANNRGIEVQPANRARLQQISGEVRHQGIVAEVRRSTVLDAAGLRSLVEERLQEGGDRLLLLLLDGVQDPHNLGACMRTADAAGVDAIIVPRHGAAGLGPTVSKVAAGAAEHIAFAPVANLARVGTAKGLRPRPRPSAAIMRRTGRCSWDARSSNQSAAG